MIKVPDRRDRTDYETQRYLLRYYFNRQFLLDTSLKNLIIFYKICLKISCNAMSESKMRDIYV